MKHKTMMLLLLSGFLCLAGCDRGDETARRESPAVPQGPATVEPGREVLREPEQTAPQPADTEREAYSRQIETRMSELDQKIGELRVRARSAGAEMQAQYESELETLRQKREVLANRLDDMRKSTGAAWKDMRESIDAALRDLETHYEQVASRFR